MRSSSSRSRKGRNSWPTFRPARPVPPRTNSSRPPTYRIAAERLASSATARARSCHSPRNFAPASSLAPSTYQNCRPASAGGTWSAAMRWASSCTSAVLPTPDTPVSSTLAPLLRLMARTRRFISSPRPRVRPMRPDRASATRSMPARVRGVDGTLERSRAAFSAFIARSSRLYRPGPCHVTTSGSSHSLRVSARSTSLATLDRWRAPRICSSVHATTWCSPSMTKSSSTRGTRTRNTPGRSSLRATRKSTGTGTSRWPSTALIVRVTVSVV
jgi:hypothetical protein